MPAVSDERWLSGRVALVTGAAQGLGFAEAIELAKRGARVVAIDRTPPNEVVTEIHRFGAEAVGLTADLSTYPGVRQALADALAIHGEVDIVINNAGIVRDRMSFNLTETEWESVLAVNLSASFYLSRDVVRHWRSSEDSRRSTKVIVNTSSESGLYGNAGQANYAAAKAGVAALTLTMATELDRYGIRVNAIAPRARTPMSLDAFGELPLGDRYDPFAPEHVASVIAWLVSDNAEGITGQVLVVHGGGIDVMRPWSITRSIRRSESWTDDALARLSDVLFEREEARRLVEPISNLFQPLRNT
jgi:NAD(P)-dependent dehydrogenase (short-subunit alcohol dehydrogenase family)